MAYDSARGEVVLFGGAHNFAYLSETWVWNGMTWAQRTPATAPPARCCHELEFDSARAQVVLFGGASTSAFGDTWLWDGTTWTEKFPSTSPSARRSHSMAYDAARAEVVLFGGQDGTTRGDTWVWAPLEITILSEFYLHESNTTLFFDSLPPGTTTAKFRDSSGLQFSGGNPWKEIGEWASVPGTIPSGAQSLPALSDLHIWLGLKNSDDQGTRFDLRAEIYKNGILIATGETFCITGITRNPNLAKEVTVSFDSMSDEVISVTDDLELRALARIGSTGGAFCGGHSNAGGVRLYFDAVDRPAKFGATFEAIP